MLSTSTSLSRSRSSGSKKDAAQRALPGGFTLVELLVVVSIMLIITSTLLLQQRKFNSATLMRTLAYNIALSIRQAQVYGTSVVGT
ncbi:prepilin-type N-terminal cleavage/methylation domain-containing protein [Patescibacteria group bacterium]|nr:prepilin-type N-terminal cleavage/methylation domain-containing protein [Patescibacteria group bacterium]